ncbi:hypothetical protein A6456_10650 [Paraburkholderia tropica]|nr:hypothetical protein A6456_10650 [Paraburkholderia tropica]
MQVQLKVDQRPKNCLVHVLVDEAFNGPRQPGFEVNHIDGNKANNVLSNFERLTRKANVQHAFDTGLCGSRRGERNSFSILTAETVAAIRAEAESFRQKNGRLKYGACAQLARKYGVARTTLSGIVRLKSWTGETLGVQFE